MRLYRVSLCILLVTSTCFLVGCAKPSASGIYWGNYAKTLYAYKKKPSPTTRMQHQNELVRLIDFASTHNTRVPPGVYAELGKLYFDQGEDAIAQRYFQLEQQLYPESTALFKQIQLAPVALPSASATPRLPLRVNPTP